MTLKARGCCRERRGPAQRAPHDGGGQTAVAAAQPAAAARHGPHWQAPPRSSRLTSLGFRSSVPEVGKIWWPRGNCSLSTLCCISQLGIEIALMLRLRAMQISCQTACWGATACAPTQQLQHRACGGTRTSGATTPLPPAAAAARAAAAESTRVAETETELCRRTSASAARPASESCPGVTRCCSGPPPRRLRGPTSGAGNTLC